MAFIYDKVQAVTVHQSRFVFSAFFKKNQAAKQATYSASSPKRLQWNWQFFLQLNKSEGGHCMFCPKCGKEIRDDVTFCPYCGVKLNANGAGQSRGNPQAGNAGGTSVHTPAGSGGAKGNRKLLIPAAAGIIVLLLAVVLLNSNRKISIAPTDYVVVQVNGMNSEGTAHYYFDYDSMAEDLAQKAELTDEQKEKIWDLLYDQENTFSLSKESGLSNGDKITVKSNLDKDLLKEYGVKLSRDSVTIKAEGLPDIHKVELGDYITLSYNGFDGAGYAIAGYDYARLKKDLTDIAAEAAPDSDGTAIENDISYLLNQIQCSANPSEKLHNGDKVETSISSETSDLTDYGIRLVSGSQTSSAEGLSEPEEIDLTDAVHVSFSGVCPNVTVEISVDDVPYYDSTSLYDLAYTNTTIQASNGEFYPVTVEYDEDALLAQGYVVTNNYKEYEISGLNDYRLVLNDIEDENLQEISGDFADNAVACALGYQNDILNDAGEMSQNIVWTDTATELILAETLTPDESYDYYYTWNELILVYDLALPVRFSDQTISQKDVYYTVTCSNVEQTPSGTLEYDDWNQQLFYNYDALQSYLQDEAAYLSDNTSVSSCAKETDDMPSLPLESLANPTAESAETSGGSIGGAYETGLSGAACTITYGGHTYMRFDQNLPWNEAKQFCEALTGEDGGSYHLVTVTSAREMSIIKALLADAPYGSYFLGATDEEFEGSWKWITGEAFDWDNWYDGQPDNYTGNDPEGENYLETGSNYNYQFNDLPKGYENCGFIAECEDAEGTDELSQTYLTDLTPAFSYSAGLQEQLQDPYGNLHFNSLSLYGDTSVVSYVLNGNYTSLDTNLSTWTETASGASFNFAVWGDGELLYSNYNYQKTDAPVSLSLDLTGVQTLKMEVSNSGECDNGYLFLNECRLTPAETQAEMSVKKEELQELRLIASGNYECLRESGMNTDPLGYFRKDYYTFDGPEGGFGAWNLDGAYTGMKAVVMAGTGSYDENTAITVKIKADREIVFRQELTIFDGPVPINLDLTGVKLLEISASKNENGGEGSLHLSDTLLTSANISDEAAKTAQTETTAFPELDAQSISRAAAWKECRDAVSSRRYYLFEESMTWEEANAFCVNAGGHLATPATWEENKAIQELLGSANSNEYWLGGRKNADSSWAWCCGSLNGTVWRLADGTENGVYTNWSGSQPDNYEEAEYLLTIYSDGTWNDNDDEPLGFIMEVDPLEETSEASAQRTVYWTDPSTDNGYLTIYDGNILYPYGVQLNASDGQSLCFDGLPFTTGDQTIRPQTLKGVLMISGSASAYADISVDIFGDGKLLYEQTGLHSGIDAIPFQVDISGVENLVVATGNEGVTDGGYVLFGYLALCGETEETSDKPCRLSELVQIDAQNCENRSDCLFRDAYSQAHDGYLALNGYENGYIVYNLNSGMSTFSGTITTSRESTDYQAQNSIKIYDGNNVLLYQIPDYAMKNGSAEFSIDITDVSVLRIATTGTVNSDGTWIYITDDKLQ